MYLVIFRIQFGPEDIESQVLLSGTTVLLSFSVITLGYLHRHDYDLLFSQLIIH